MPRRIPVPGFIHLPLAQKAQIAEEKLVRFALNPDHPQNRSRAQYFEQSLGITRDDWTFLRDQILAAVRTAPVQKLNGKGWFEDGRPRFGIEFEIHVPIVGRNGRRHEVHTSWILESANGPRFCSIRPLQPAERANRTFPA